MRALRIDADEKTVTECEIEQDDNVLNEEYMIVPRVNGLSGKDALYALLGPDASRAEFRIKGKMSGIRAVGFVVGHTIDGEVTAARTSLKTLKKMVAFP